MDQELSLPIGYLKTRWWKGAGSALQAQTRLCRPKRGHVPLWRSQKNFFRLTVAGTGFLASAVED
jgi:hypothetical protein